MSPKPTHEPAASGDVLGQDRTEAATVRRVLVMCEDSVVRDLIEIILKSHGFVVDQAETLLEVFALVAVAPVSACVIDCRRLAGRGTKLLREVGDLGTVRPIALIDARDGERLAAARGAGALAVVECPFENAELIAAVGRLAEPAADAVQGRSP